MPAKSKAQFKLMKAAENNPEFAEKVGIKSEVAKEFTEENTGKKSYENLPEKKPDWKDSPRWSKLKKKLGK